tara:strand:- start:1862 stop:2854 length:993 start_codon:yes stop_codon:yes gene_type:complete
MGALSLIAKKALGVSLKKRYTGADLGKAYDKLTDSQKEMMKKNSGISSKGDFTRKFERLTEKQPTLNIPVSVRNKVMKFLGTAAVGSEAGVRTDRKNRGQLNKKAQGGFSRSGDIGRTEIDPRIGGTKGDAGPAGKAGSKGPGTLGGSRGRTTIDPRIGGQKGDAGFSGKAKALSGFGKAFSIAYAKGPGTVFTFKGKKYKAIKKHAGKGPPKNRKEDKVTKATMVKGKRDTTEKFSKKDIAAAAKLVAKNVPSLKKTPTPASGRFGQRKAGGLSEGVKKVKAMEAKNGGFPDLSGDGKITKKDILMGRGVIKKRGGGAAIKGMNFKGVF